jgi:hypothetical protein
VHLTKGGFTILSEGRLANQQSTILTMNQWILRLKHSG